MLSSNSALTHSHTCRTYADVDQRLQLFSTTRDDVGNGRVSEDSLVHSAVRYYVFDGENV